MAVYKPKYRDKKTGEPVESDIWWYEFIYSGQRIRESAKTTRKTVAQEAEKDHRRRLERAAAGMPTEAGRSGLSPSLRCSRPMRRSTASITVRNPLSWFRIGASMFSGFSAACLLPDLTAARISEYMERRARERRQSDDQSGSDGPLAGDRLHLEGSLAEAEEARREPRCRPGPGAG